jgi:predicted molibdopterin-dependent oxidoreductase YjgC
MKNEIDQIDSDYEEGWNIACPKCGEGCEEIAIQISVWIRLTPDGSEVQDGDHEWDENSKAECVSCGFKGTVKDFETIEE